MSRRRSDIAVWAVFNLLAIAVVVLLTITCVHARRHSEVEAETADEEDTAGRQGAKVKAPPPPQKKPVVIKCKKDITKLCCHLRTTITANGKIKVLPPDCGTEYVMKCCPGLNPNLEEPKKDKKPGKKTKPNGKGATNATTTNATANTTTTWTANPKPNSPVTPVAGTAAKGSSILDMTLGDIAQCIQDVILNLLQFKLTVVGGDKKKGCCNVPVLRNACSRL